MKVIYKYSVTQSFTLQLPKGAKVLHVECQGSDPMMWVEQETMHQKETRHFTVFGTGHKIPEGINFSYIGTFLMLPFVWHLYEVI